MSETGQYYVHAAVEKTFRAYLPKSGIFVQRI